MSTEARVGTRKAEAPRSGPPSRRSKASKVPRGTHVKGNSLAPLWIILILVVVGAVAAVVSVRRSQQRERLAAHLLQERKQQATVARKKIEDAANTLIAIAELALVPEADAKRDVLRVLGRPLFAGEIPAAPEPTVESAEEVPAQDVVDETQPGPAGADGRTAPAGITTREELERMRGEAAREPRPSATPEKPKSQPKIWKLGQQVLRNIEQIRENADIADRFIELARLEEQEVYREMRLDVAIRKISGIKERAVEIEKLIKESQDALDRAKAKCASIAGLRTEFERQEKLRLEREEEARKEREHRELIAMETERATELVRETDQMVADVAPDQALDVLAAALPDYQTEEGRRIVSLSIEQCEKVAEMKRILIATLNATPLRWGWRQSGGGPRDIVGADQTHVEVSGGRAPWNDVSPPQFKYVVLQYVEGRAKMPVTQRTSVGLGAAVLLLKKGNAKEAGAILQKLLYLHPKLSNEADRLVPLSATQREDNQPRSLDVGIDF